MAGPAARQVNPTSWGYRRGEAQRLKALDMGFQEDRRRDAYVALHEWQQRTGESLDWQQVLFPEEVLKWASADPEVSRLLRHRY